MFPNTCKVFPNMERKAIPKSEYARVIARALRNECRRSSVKTVMRWAEASDRSVQNWQTGNNMPSAESLIMLTGHSSEVLNAWLHLAGLPHVVPMMRFMELVFLIKDEIETIEYMWEMMQPESKKRR